jgi:hypothetical protein
MKKNLLLILLSLSSLASYAQIDIIKPLSFDIHNGDINTDILLSSGTTLFLAKQQISWDMDSSANEIKQKHRYNNKYNSQGFRTSTLEQAYRSSNWVDSLRDSITYNANNQIISGFTQLWNVKTSKWEDYADVSIIYDTTKHTRDYLYRGYNVNTSQWANLTHQFTYLSSAGLDSILLFNPNAQNTSIKYQTVDTFIRGAGGTLKTMTEWNWNTTKNVFEPFRKLQYSYNTDGTLKNYQYYSWDAKLAIYVKKARYEDFYNAYSQLTSEKYIGITSTGTDQNYYQYLYTYDTKGNRSTITYQYWLTDHYVTSYKFNQFFDNDNNLIRKDFYVYSNGSFSYGITFRYTIETITDIYEVTNPHVTIYPVPANNFIKVTSPTKGKIAVFNDLGIMVYQSASIGNSESIDCSEWPAGMYVVRIEGKEKFSVQKIIKN